MQDVKPSTQVKATTQADKIEGAENIETHEAPMKDVPLPVALVDKPATEMSLAETFVSEVPPATKAVVIESVTIGEHLS